MTGSAAGTFLDSHSHKVEEQSGGLLIGLEGSPRFEGTLTNAEAFEVRRGDSMFLPVFYVTKDFPDSDSIALKYHARREGYTACQVIQDLRKRTQARLVVMDTLNEPYWDYKDYWRVVDAFPEKQFILAHCGGFDIHNFIKIVMFQSNVWADFAFTQTLFGFTEEQTPNRLVCDSIRFCLDHPKISQRVFFGSDNPFVSQRKAADRFSREENAEGLLTNNLLRLYDVVKR